MDKDAVASYTAATELALRILTERLKRIFNHEPLTNGEAIAVGRAIGWLTLLTTGTDDDFMKELLESVKSVKPSTKLPKKLPQTMSVMPSVGMPSIVPPYIASAAGRKKTRRVPMKGGGTLGKIVIGLIGVFMGDTTREAQKMATVRDAALEQIRAACPANLTDPAPADNVLSVYYGHTPEWQKWKDVQDTYTTVCSTKRAEGVKNVTQAYETLQDAITQYEQNLRDHASDAVTVGALSGVATGAYTGAKVGAPSGPVGVGTGIIVGGITGGVGGTMLGARAQGEAQNLITRSVDHVSRLADVGLKNSITQLSTAYGAPLPPSGGRMRKSNRRTLRKRGQF